MIHKNIIANADKGCVSQGYGDLSPLLIVLGELTGNDSQYNFQIFLKTKLFYIF